MVLACLHLVAGTHQVLSPNLDAGRQWVRGLTSHDRILCRPEHDNATLFVGDLPPYWASRDLEAFFLEVGVVCPHPNSQPPSLLC